jgi:SulP family sulfate permease
MKFSETGQWFAKKLSVVRWIRAYNKKLFKGDILGGITVGIMLIPQSMAYAVLAGVPPVYGLYASVVPLLIYPLFTTTRHVFYGVIAVDMIIVSTSVGLIASPGSSHYIMLVIVLAGMVGLIQIAMSVARLGFIINLLSKPVITGFALAAPIIIILSQLDNLLGLKTGQKTHIYGMIADYIHKIGGIHLIPALFGVGSIIFLIIIRRFFPSFPKSLLLIIDASLIVWLVSFPAHTLAIVGKVPKGISHFKAPSFTLDDLRRLFPTAITLALIQFMDVTSVIRTLESNKAGTIKPNR